MAKSIDTQIKENLIAAIAAIVINEDPEPGEFVYNTNVAKVESARKIDTIPCKNYVMVIPNEPVNEFDDTIRADELEYIVWFLDGEEESDEIPFTDRLQEVQPDFLRAIRLDPSRGGLAQNTTMESWDFGIYTDANGGSHEGVWMRIKIDRMLNPDNPYEIAN